MKAYDYYGADFRNILLAFENAVSTPRLMKEFSDINIRDCGKRTGSYYVYMTTKSHT